MLEIRHVQGPFDVGGCGQVRNKLRVELSAGQGELAGVKCDGVLPAAQRERHAGEIRFRLPVMHAHRAHGEIVERDVDAFGIGERSGGAL